MTEASRINAKVSITGEVKRQAPQKLVNSYDQLKRKVEALNWEADRKTRLLEYCKKYPQGALDYVWKNIYKFDIMAAKACGGAVAETVKPEPVAPKETPKFVRPSFTEIVDDEEEVK